MSVIKVVECTPTRVLPHQEGGDKGERVAIIAQVIKVEATPAIISPTPRRTGIKREMRRRIISAGNFQEVSSEVL